MCGGKLPSGHFSSAVTVIIPDLRNAGIVVRRRMER